MRKEPSVTDDAKRKNRAMNQAKVARFGTNAGTICIIRLSLNKLKT
ncbi:MAG: hypothetical protein HOI21_00035 [Bacteroidetes Order II. Incertae sedis bacterium]|jgi:hypothetical protein|nr:hypothetical protein [Bacteroidetes Order II. bacterium]